MSISSFAAAGSGTGSGCPDSIAASATSTKATTSATGGLAEELPLPRGGFCSFNADGTKLAYNRVFREFRTWKRYRGGMADDVWVYDFATKKTTQLTDDPAQDIAPMWHGDTIYFVSDRRQGEAAHRVQRLCGNDPDYWVMATTLIGLVS